MERTDHRLPAHRRSARGRARVRAARARDAQRARSRWFPWDANVRSWLAEAARREFSHAYGPIRLPVAALARRAPARQKKRSSACFAGVKVAPRERRASSIASVGRAARCIGASLQASRTSTTAANCGLRDAHLRYLERAIDIARAKQRGVGSGVRSCRGGAVAANRERRLIEKLKERRCKSSSAKRRAATSSSSTKPTPVASTSG